MGAKILIPAVKDRQFQGIDHATDGVDDSAGQEPAKSASGKGGGNFSKSQYTYPAHGDVNERGKPLWTGNP